MTAALKGAIRNFGLTAALALGALLSAPSSAAAQACDATHTNECYTLTFGTTNTNDNKVMATPYLGNGNTEVPTSKITITDGWSSEFGQTSFSAGTVGTTCAQSVAGSGICFTKDQVPSGEAASFQANAASGIGVGEFVFTPVGNNVQGLISFTLGNSANADQAAMVRIYALDGTTLLATYTDANVGKKASSTIALTDFTPTSGTIAQLQTNMLPGYRFEWGTNANADANGDRLFIDNMIFKSELAPEPNTMLLLGTGLLGLAPLARRRRKKA